MFERGLAFWIPQERHRRLHDAQRRDVAVRLRVRHDGAGDRVARPRIRRQHDADERRRRRLGGSDAAPRRRRRFPLLVLSARLVFLLLIRPEPAVRRRAIRPRSRARRGTAGALDDRLPYADRLLLREKHVGDRRVMRSGRLGPHRLDAALAPADVFRESALDDKVVAPHAVVPHLARARGRPMRNLCVDGCVRQLSRAAQRVRRGVGDPVARCDSEARGAGARVRLRLPHLVGQRFISAAHQEAVSEVIGIVAERHRALAVFDVARMAAVRLALELAHDLRHLRGLDAIVDFVLEPRPFGCEDDVGMSRVVDRLPLNLRLDRTGGAAERGRQLRGERAGSAVSGGGGRASIERSGTHARRRQRQNEQHAKQRSVKADARHPASGAVASCGES